MYAYWLSLVSEKQKKRILSFHYREDQERTLVGDVLSRTLLSKKTGIPNHLLKFYNGEYGKPYLKGKVNYAFNVSHSGTWVVCALDDLCVGVDVEKVQKVELELAKRCFCYEEYCYLRDLKKDEREKSFYSLWTLKESYIKYWGRGLSIPLNSFCFRNVAGKFYLNSSKYKIIFTQFDLAGMYQLSVCATKAVLDNQVKYVNYNELQAF